MASAPISSGELIEMVRKSGLVDDRLDKWLLKNPTLPAQPQATAAKLVKDGLLTSFHATHMLSGKFKGFVIGQYKVLDQIGMGGMGVIFLAEHLTMKRRVALKVLPNDKAADEESLQRFHREARIVAALDHPNVVKAFDVDKCNDLHFMAMEYIDGESLEHLLRRRGPLPFEEAADFIAQAARGLQHAHERGLVHRDIKPGNLILDKSGVIKILDMGLARFFEENSTLTTELCNGSVIGTADYMAPEQAVNSHDVDIRADIYSLGATLYALLAGQPPYASLTVTQKLLAHHMRTPEPLQQIRPGTPDELAEIAMKMMAKQPADRYQTPDEVASVLAAYLSNPFDLVSEPLPLDDSPPVDDAPVTNSAAVQKRPRWLLPASIAGVVMIAGIVIAVAASGDRKPPDNRSKTDLTARSDNANPIEPVPPASTDQPGREVGRFPEQAAPVEGLALSPNGTRLLTCDGNSAKLWDIEKATLVHDLKGHRDVVRYVAFDSTGDRALSCSIDGTIRIWDLRDGHEALQLAQPSAKFQAAVFSPDGKHVFSGTKDGLAQYWDLESKKAIHTLNRSAAEIDGVAVSADGRTGYTGGSDGFCRFWDLTNGEEAAKFDMKGDAIQALALYSDGQRLAVAGTGLAVLDPAIAYEIRSFAAANVPAPSAFTFSRNRRFLATAGQDRKIRLWSVATGKLINTFGEHPDDITGLVFLHDDVHLISTCRDKTIRKWAIADAWARAPRHETKTGFVKVYDTHEEQIDHLALSPSDNVLAGGSRSGKIQFWDLETGKRLKEFDGHKGAVNSIAFSSSGRLLASSGQDGRIKIWNTVAWQEMKTITASKGPVWSIALSPDGRLVFSGSDDGIGRIWDVKTGGLVKTWGKPSKKISSVAWSSDGKFIYTAGIDFRLKCWEVETSRLVFDVDRGANPTEVTISKDGLSILSPGEDGAVLMYDAHTGTEIRKFSAVWPVPPKLGQWQYIGPFDNSGRKGFETVYPPETEIDLTKKYPARGGNVGWKPGAFADGSVNNLAIFAPQFNTDSVVYLYREIEAASSAEMPASFGSDDTLTVWCNGEKIISENVSRGAAPDQNKATLKLKAGKNTLLMKICQGEGQWGFYFADETRKPQRGGMFSGDGSLAVTTTGDKVFVWDVATGSVYQRFEGHHDKTQASVITSDGRHIVIGTFDKTVGMWGVRPR